MTPSVTELAASTACGQLGILHLKRYWAKAMASRLGQLPGDSLEDEGSLDTALLNALGLGLEPTIQYLYQHTPGFQAFEEWIQTVTGGLPNADKVAAFNAQILGTSLTKPRKEDASPVLSADDLAHWDTYGYVIVKEAISRQDCDQTIELICNFLQMERYQPHTWYAPHPGKQGIMVQLFQHTLLTSNRESPRIRAAYEQLWNRTDLWVTTDRVGFSPPQTTKWPFPGPRLHWDVRLDRPIPYGLQGLLYLSDTQAHQGAFSLVPAFQHRVVDWLTQLPPKTDPHTQDLEALGAIPIPGAAGDFIIWHHALPHGSSPNSANEPRFVQYINYAP
ncbi:phytanoyl-CoA dioxygenase family protein [Spirosoma utsteinense]|uniref:Phytanoyl-CoA dioxygenase n=1 Tax=Spirosoma utsteinense TaxID=2585773 RepID=A0ABR6W6Y2_9BACT|nr:phytanoyl-CoA dioxygenase family protein [Spirosoma utsteinense]MBC3786149.1 hypothetical protein [Spirosoma utsteinense]MBC3792338.1 hypothetical protein [Spirosoma utsteinense]